MRKNLLHILISLLLTVAMTDYVWIEIFRDDAVAVEVESEGEEGSNEELREGRNSELRHDFDFIAWLPSAQSFSFQRIFSGIVKIGNSYRPALNVGQHKLFILNCQLRLDCA